MSEERLAEERHLQAMAAVPTSPSPPQELFAKAEEHDVHDIEVEMGGAGVLAGELFYKMRFLDKKTKKVVETAPMLSAVGARAMRTELSRFCPITIPVYSVELVKYEESPDSWKYEADVKMRNEVTGLETLGSATRAYRPDPKNFNRRSALALAEAKAIKGQVSIESLLKYYNEITDDGKDTSKIKVFGNDGTTVKYTTYDSDEKPGDPPCTEAQAKEMGELARRKGLNDEEQKKFMDTIREMTQKGAEKRLAAWRATLKEMGK